MYCHAISFRSKPRSSFPAFAQAGIPYFWPPCGHFGRSGWIYKLSEPSLSHNRIITVENRLDQISTKNAQLMSAHVSSCQLPSCHGTVASWCEPSNSWHLCNIFVMISRHTIHQWSAMVEGSLRTKSANVWKYTAWVQEALPFPLQFCRTFIQVLRFEGCKPWWTNANFMHFKNLSVCHWLSNFDISVLFHSSFLHAWRHTAAPCELYWTGFLVTLGACSAGLQEHILAAGLSWGSAAISTPRSAIDYTCSTTWKRQKGSFRTGHCWSQTQKNAEFVEHISVRWWANLCSKYVVGYEAQEDIVTHTSLTKSEL